MLLVLLWRASVSLVLLTASSVSVWFVLREKWGIHYTLSCRCPPLPPPCQSITQGANAVVGFCWKSPFNALLSLWTRVFFRPTVLRPTFLPLSSISAEANVQLSSRHFSRLVLGDASFWPTVWWISLACLFLLDRKVPAAEFTPKSCSSLSPQMKSNHRLNSEMKDEAFGGWVGCRRLHSIFWHLVSQERFSWRPIWDYRCLSASCTQNTSPVSHICVFLHFQG